VVAQTPGAGNGQVRPARKTSTSEERRDKHDGRFGDAAAQNATHTDKQQRAEHVDLAGDWSCMPD